MDETGEASKKLKVGTKRYAVLKAILDAGNDGLDCFRAAHVLMDYVLRSTVSDIQNQYGLNISRRPHVVRNGFGGETHCVRYWLEGTERDHAARLLGMAEPQTVH